MNSFNIFDGILYLENMSSQMLVNLTQYKLFKKELLEFFDIDSDDFDNLEFVVEKSLGKHGRIDIMLYDGEKEYLIENKVYIFRDLTGNQPEGYLKYLEENENAEKLIFLIPKQYEKEKILLYNDKIRILYWEDFIDKLKKSGLCELNMLIKEFTDYFNDFFEIKKISFTSNEIKIIKNTKEIGMRDSNIPVIMKKLIEVVDGVKKIQVTNRNKPSEYGGYGYEVKNEKYGLNDDIFIWYGIDYDAWEKKGYPLMIWIESVDKKIEDSLMDIGFEEYMDSENNKALIFLFKDISTSTLSENISKKIEDAIETVKKDSED